MTRRQRRRWRIRENACRRHAAQARTWADVFRGPFADIAVFAMPRGRQRWRMVARCGAFVGAFVARSWAPDRAFPDGGRNEVRSGRLPRVADQEIR